MSEGQGCDTERNDTMRVDGEGKAGGWDVVVGVMVGVRLFVCRRFQFEGQMAGHLAFECRIRMLG